MKNLKIKMNTMDKSKDRQVLVCVSQSKVNYNIMNETWER